jgi:hypothetical protein
MSPATYAAAWRSATLRSTDGSAPRTAVAFAARAFRTVFGVSDRALQQRATQQLAGDRQFADQLLARSEGLLANHSQK